MKERDLTAWANTILKVVFVTVVAIFLIVIFKG